jgi:serine protease Do
MLLSLLLACVPSFERPEPNPTGGAPTPLAAPVAIPAPPKLPNGYNPMLSLAPLVEQVKPSVVNVYVTTRTAVPAQYQYSLGLPRERVQKGQGSGFVVTPDGYILTNNHVVNGATDIRVKFESGDEFSAKLIGADAGSDVAVLKIESTTPLPYLPFGDSDAARVGDWVIAVGNPLGLGHSVSAGIVSGKGREVPDLDSLEEFIQTDASINPGNSGGPLIGTDGTVLGMNTAIVSGANSVGFSIPAAHLQLVMSQLREKGHVSRGYLGVGSAPLSARGRAHYEVDHGVVVTEVAANSPAHSLGLVPGDVVLEVNGKQVSDPRDLFRAVASRQPGEAVPFTWLRDGTKQEGQVTLAERPRGD